MPQMEKFGYASAATTVTSAPGSTSRARSAALIPASLPPMATMCMITSCFPFASWLPASPGRRAPAISVAVGLGEPRQFLAIDAVVRDDDPAASAGVSAG
jgi:hypothetical protein